MVTDSELDPQARAFVEAAEGPPPYALSVEGTRREFADLLTTDDLPPIDGVRDLGIPGPGGALPVRIYDPGGDGPLPVLVYYHGGGWVRGSIETHEEFCRSMARRIGCLVLSVEYRRPPEHPFPAAVKDAYAAADWAAEYVDTVGGDPARIAVGGESAGGNLAAAVALMARNRDTPDLAHQLLLYPVLEHAFDTESYEALAEGYLPTRTTMRWYWDQYLAEPLDGYHPYASPLRASDHSGLPPATLLTVGFDPLRDEGRAYVECLRGADVPVTHLEYEAMIHGFLSFPDAIDQASEGRDEIAAVLRDRLDVE